jgi:hypothetical protein
MNTDYNGNPDATIGANSQMVSYGEMKFFITVSTIMQQIIIL